MGDENGMAVKGKYADSDPVFERRHSDSDEYLSPLETTMTRRSGGRRSESRPRSRSRRSRDDYDSDLLYRDSEVSVTKKKRLPLNGWSARILHRKVPSCSLWYPFFRPQ